MMPHLVNEGPTASPALKMGGSAERDRLFDDRVGFAGASGVRDQSPTGPAVPFGL